MSVGFALVLLVLVVLQGMLGMLTVTWLLKPLIVTGHLVGGLTTFALLLWLWLSMRAEDRPVDGRSVLAGNRLVEGGSRARLWAGLALAALAVQVALGGWTSSNYAAVACPDLPQVPGPVDPRGGLRGRIRVVARPRASTTRAACSIIPRAWRSISRIASAPWWPAILLLLAAFAALRGLGAGPRWAALAVLAALALQIFIGVFMVLRAFPLELAAAHNAGAALLVGATVLLNRKLRPVADFQLSPISGRSDRLNCRAPTEPAPLATTEPIVQAATSALAQLLRADQAARRHAHRVHVHRGHAAGRAGHAAARCADLRQSRRRVSPPPAPR